MKSVIPFTSIGQYLTMGRVLSPVLVLTTADLTCPSFHSISTIASFHLFLCKISILICTTSPVLNALWLFPVVRWNSHNDVRYSFFQRFKTLSSMFLSSLVRFKISDFPLLYLERLFQLDLFQSILASGRFQNFSLPYNDLK